MIELHQLSQDTTIMGNVNRIVKESNVRQKEIIDLLREFPRKIDYRRKIPFQIIPTDERFCKLAINMYGSKGLFRLPNNMKLQITPNVDVFSAYVNSPPVNLPSSQNESIIARKCTANIDLRNLKQIRSDQFTNSIFVCYTLNEMCKLNDIHPFHVQVYAGYIYDNTAITLYEGDIICPLSKLYLHSEYTDTYEIYKELGIGFVSITPDNIMKILTQLTAALHAYNSFVGYINGDLRASKVMISSVPVDLKYMGIPIEANFTCKMTDFTTSSCIIPASDNMLLRIFNGNPLADLYFKFNSFDYQGIKDNNCEFFYTIDDTFVTQTLFKSQNMDTPYYSSFDYYTLLVSFLIDPHVYRIFFSTPFLYKTFWLPAWKYDSNEAQLRIYNLMVNQDTDSMDNVLSVLSGLKLRCDAVHVIMDNLVDNEIDKSYLLWNDSVVTDESCDWDFDEFNSPRTSPRY